MVETSGTDVGVVVAGRRRGAGIQKGAYARAAQTQLVWGVFPWEVKIFIHGFPFTLHGKTPCRPSRDDALSPCTRMGRC